MKMKDQRKFAHLSTGIFWHGSGAFGKNIPRQYSWLFYFKRWSQLLVARLHRPVQQCCIQRFGPCKTKGSWKCMRAANWAGFFPRQTGRGLVFVCLCGIETLVWVNFRDLTNLTPQSRWFEWESSLKWSYFISGNDQLHPDSSLLSTLDEVVRGFPPPGRTLHPLPWQKCDTWKARWIFDKFWGVVFGRCVFCDSYSCNSRRCVNLDSYQGFLRR